MICLFAQTRNRIEREMSVEEERERRKKIRLDENTAEILDYKHAISLSRGREVVEGERPI